MDLTPYITHVLNKTSLFVAFIIISLILLIILGNIIISLTTMDKHYTWVYNTYNDNIYVLVFIIIMLFLIIYNFNYYKTKTDSTYDVEIVKSDFNNISNFNNNNNNNNNSYQNSNGDNYNINLEELQPNIKKESKELMTSVYNPPIITNPYNNLFISNDEKEQWKIAKSLLDGNEESLPNTNGSPKNYGYIPKNDILQTNSTLFANDNNSYSYNDKKLDTSTIGDYASLDSLGKGLTDTLGGIHTELGYTVLDEQLGTFKKQEIYNPYTYDEKANYNTGMSANTIDGNPNGTNNGSNIGNTNGIINLSSSNISKCANGQPVFIQKDFDGVANIFAPNIIIQNPPLTSDGYPDISVRM